MLPRGDTHGSIGGPCKWRVGSPIYSHDSKGTVVAVDEAAGVISVEWLDGAYGPIKYPIDATYLRGPMPWES